MRAYTVHTERPQTESDYVIFTDEDKNFDEFSEADIALSDSNLGIRYAKKEIQEDTHLLLQYNCPDPDCDVSCHGWPSLHRHVKQEHHKIMCDLCTRNKKVFTHEHELFTKDELRRHEEKGDDKPGAADQSGFRGHPRCGFCRMHFYSEDELYTHCREKHEKCFLCERANPGERPAYYLNYDTLEQHFKTDHFLCLDKECLDKKFVVFESEMDLKAHQLEKHPSGLTKDHRKVDLSDFSLRERYHPIRGGAESSGRVGRGGQQRGPGRGRDPNSEPLPPSSAQPMRRDELAFQRAQALLQAAPTPARAFGSQLTPASRPTPTSPPRNATPVSRRTNNAEFPSLGEVTRALPGHAPSVAPEGSGVPTRSTTREQEVRQMRHQAVLDRASNLLRGDQTKLNSFRSAISAYKSSSRTAAQLIETFFALFDASSTELGKLVKELADIFEMEVKREGLLKAWNDWRAINEDYPSLPGSSSQSGTVNGPAHGGNRVLRLKSSTARSSQSQVSRTASWGTASNSVFPSLPPSSGINGKGKTSNPSWRAGASVGVSVGASGASSSRAQAKPRRSAPSNVEDTTAFPALPTAAKPTTTLYTPGYNGRLIKRVGQNDAGNSVWGQNQRASAEEEQTAPETAPEERKKKGRKKQVLMNWG